MKRIYSLALTALLAGSAMAQDVSVGIERPRITQEGGFIYDDFAYITTADFNKGDDGLTVQFYQTPELEATLAKPAEDQPTESGYATGRVFLRGVEYNPDYVWKIQTSNYKNEEGRGAEKFTFGFDLTIADGKQFAVNAIDMDLLLEQNPAWRIRIVKDSEELYNSGWAVNTGGYNQVVWGVGGYAHITSTEAKFTWGDNDGCLQYYPVFDADVNEGVVTYKYEQNKLLPANLVLAAGQYQVLVDIGYLNENLKNFSFDHVKLEGTVTGGNQGGSGNAIGIVRPRITQEGGFIYDDFAYITTADFNKSIDGAIVSFYQTPELEATLAKPAEDQPTESGYATGRVFLRGVEYNPDYVWKIQTSNYKNEEGRGAEKFTFGFDLTIADGKQFAVNAIDMDLLLEQNPAWRIRIVKDSEELYNSGWAVNTGGYNQVVWGVGGYAHITSTEAKFTWGDNDGCLQYYPVFDADVNEGVVTYKYEQNKLLPADLVLAAGQYQVLVDIGYLNENLKNFSFDHLTLEGSLSEGTTTPETGRKWDFTKWSNATIAALQADAAAGTTGWSNDEKNNGNTVEGCYWCAAETNADGTISANGVVIEELKGLVFDTDYTQMRSLAIATNYPSTSLGTYQGPQYLWLGSKGKKCFTIPNVTAGSEITFEMESHKPAEARGIQLKQGGTQIGEDFKPTTFASQSFLVENAGDVEVWNTNGCHIYTITVTDGTNGIGEVKTVRVANNAIYNLAGQRIAAPVKGQIYIQNGKKYMAK